MRALVKQVTTKQLSERRSFLCSCWRLEPERAPLVRPRHRKINETFETETSRQTSFDCRLDDIRRKECERQGHPDRTLSLPSCEASDSKVWRGSDRSSSS